MNINLEWNVCLGSYKIVNNSASHDGQYLTPVSDHIAKFNPLKKHSALLKQLLAIDTNQGFLKFANHYGLLNHSSIPESVSEWHLTENLMKDAIHGHYNNNYEPLKYSFNKEALGDLKTNLNLDINPPALVFSINSLKQGNWWQFIEAITKSQIYERCAFCATWFTVGTGIKRRKDK